MKEDFIYPIDADNVPENRYVWMLRCIYKCVCVYDEHGLQVIINCWGRQIAILPMPTGNVSLLYFLLLTHTEKTRL